MDTADLLRGAYWVQPGRLLAGPYPGAATQARTLQRLENVLAAHVTYFLDLTEENEVRAYWLDVSAAAAARGVRVHHRRMPIRDMDVPTHADMRAILDTLDSALAEGYIVYVHCLGGVGRTGTVIGCWLVRQGMDGQAALSEITRLRGGQFGSPETTEQRLMVASWQEDETP